jgi:hypothetical protein
MKREAYEIELRIFRILTNQPAFATRRTLGNRQCHLVQNLSHQTEHSRLAAKSENGVVANYQHEKREYGLSEGNKQNVTLSIYIV